MITAPATVLRTCWMESRKHSQCWTLHEGALQWKSSVTALRQRNGHLEPDGGVPWNLTLYPSETPGRSFFPSSYLCLWSISWNLLSFFFPSQHLLSIAPCCFFACLDNSHTFRVPSVVLKITICAIVWDSKPAARKDPPPSAWRNPPGCGPRGVFLVCFRRHGEFPSSERVKWKAKTSRSVWFSESQGAFLGAVHKGRCCEESEAGTGFLKPAKSWLLMFLELREREKCSCPTAVQSAASRSCGPLSTLKITPNGLLPLCYQLFT